MATAPAGSPASSFEDLGTVGTGGEPAESVSFRDRSQFLMDSLGWALAAAAVVLMGAIGFASYFLLVHREQVAAPLPALSAEASAWLGDRQEVAVYKDGKLFLYGSAHSEEERGAMVELANSLTPAENVVAGEYYVDPRRPRRQVTTMRVADPVLFELDSAEISPAFEPVLGFVAGLMVSNPRVNIVIVGHTDEIGNDQRNLSLSQLRAQAAMDAIVNRGGDRTRLLAEGRGESQPIADNNDPTGRQMNRRVEFQLTGF